MTDQELGKIAHEAYCKWARVSPVWDKVCQDIRDGWIGVAVAVRDQIKKAGESQ